MIRDRGNFVLTTVVPDIGMGNRRSASPRGADSVPDRLHGGAESRHRTPSPSRGRLKPLHPLDVQRQAHQVPFAPNLVQAPHAESPETQRLLDPSDRRLR